MEGLLIRASEGRLAAAAAAAVPISTSLMISFERLTTGDRLVATNDLFDYEPKKFLREPGI